MSTWQIGQRAWSEFGKAAEDCLKRFVDELVSSTDTSTEDAAFVGFADEVERTMQSGLSKEKNVWRNTLTDAKHTRRLSALAPTSGSRSVVGLLVDKCHELLTEINALEAAADDESVDRVGEKRNVLLRCFNAMSTLAW
jgi:hypothetical protein